MALTPARQTMVVAELRYIHTYLTSLARELDAAPLTDKQVAHLLYLLADLQEKPHCEEKIQEVSTHRTLSKPNRATAQVQTR